MSQNENNKAAIPRKKDPTTPFVKGKNYLLVIGIDEYTHCPRLYNAVKDAQDIVEVLQNRFQFEATNIKPLYNQEATKQNIYNAFRYFKRKVTPKDNFIVYFSGHGEYDKDFGVGYWIPVEAGKEANYQYIPNSEVRNILTSIKSHHTFLMVDSCFSGALFAKGTGRNIPLRKERDPSRWGLTAGRNEIVTDGSPGANSPFAQSILYQLKNTEQPLGVAELCDKVLEVVSANAEQTPRGEPLKVEGHQGGQFVFHLKMDELADWKAALAADSIAVYQSFLTKYPDGKYISDAKLSVKRLQAENLWQKIELAKDANLHEVKTKLRLVNQYVAAYENQTHYDEALNVGELLEYIKQFLLAKTSEYSLRKFLRKTTPDVLGANEIKVAAQQLVNNWGTEKTAPSTPADKPVIKKTIEITKPTKTKKTKPKEVEIKPPQPSPSFLEKYGKYLVLVLLVSLAIWGIVSFNNRSYITHLNDPKVITKDKPVEQPAATTTANAGTFKDSRDGQSYKWIRLKDGKKWVAQNLNYEASNSWCYDEKSSNCSKYGRLYSWQAALCMT